MKHPLIHAAIPVRHIGLLLLLFALVTALAGAPAVVHAAGGAQQAQPTVSGAFFYSPTCSHCHQVILNDWPLIEERFGNQLRVVFVDITTTEGSLLMSQALDYLGMNPTGVPLLIIGHEAMVGSLEIPERAGDVIQAGLDAGGVSMLPIPALTARLDAQLAETEGNRAQAAADASVVDEAAETVDDTATALANEPAQIDTSNIDTSNTESVPATSIDPVTESSDTNALSTSAADALAAMEEAAAPTSIAERIARDPIANSVAIVVLVLCLLSLVLFVLQRLLDNGEQTRWGALGKQIRPWALAIVGALGVAMALTIVTGALDAPLIVLLALVQVVAFLMLLAVAFVPAAARLGGRWMLVVGAVAGMLVALYLAYVESTANPAVCGAVGECNVVQQSAYAAILGIPIGVLGMVGYALILGVALTRIFAPQWMGSYDTPILEALTVAGVAFSTWLTFLEPFVIGATCAWCLLSALWMLGLLWLVVRWESQTQKTRHSSRPTRHAQRKPQQRHAGRAG